MSPAFDYDREDSNDTDLRYVSISPDQLSRAQENIASCAACNSEDAEIPFDWLLREVAGEKGCVDYILGEPARCPRCGAEIHEKTLVEPEGGIQIDSYSL